MSIMPVPNSVQPPKSQPYLVVDSPYELARWRPLVNWVLYIPHAIIINALQILARAVFLVCSLVLIFTDYYYRVWTYVAMVENDYPKFGLPTI
jgi:hypothetical protein